jgi:hypothetical protein
VRITLPTTAKVGETLSITDGTTPQTHVLTAADIAAGHYDTTFAKPAEGGTLNVSTTLTDLVGNVSPTATAAAVLDTVSPTPTIAITTDVNHDGFINAAEQGTATTDSVRVGLAGLTPVAKVGETLTITNGTTPQTHVLTAADIAAGFYLTTFAKPAEGATLTVSTTLTDLVGNVSPTATASAVLDTTAPTVAIGLAHTVTSDTGSSDLDGITANTKPVILGTGEPNSTVTVVVTDPIAGAITYTTTTNASGAWSLDLTTAVPKTGTLPTGGLHAGTIGLGILSTDAAGNSASTTGSFTEDLRTPNAPVLTLSNPTNPTVDDGLIRDTWNASVGTYNNGSGVAPTTMEASVDGFVSAGTAPATSTVLTNAAEASVASGVASLTHGLIYLTAGTSYQFNSTADDSFLLEIGGKVVSSITWGANAGSVVSGTVTPTVSGWYTTEIYHDNENGPGNFAVQISVNGATAVNMDTSHFQLVQSIQDLNSAGVRTTSLQGSPTGETNDGYYTALPTNEGHEGTWIPISNIAASLTTPIATDTLSVQLTGLTANTEVTDGTHWATAGANGIVDISTFTLNSLSVLAPLDYTSTMNAVVQATDTDTANGLTSSTTHTLTVTSDPYTTITGTTGTGADERITGTSGHDTLTGGAGNDLIIGGAGNDTMTGGSGSDVFRWYLADKGTTAAPAVDTITDWSNALIKNGGDVLDLRDLLVGGTHGTTGVGNLTNYLHFETSPTSTTVDVSSSGGYSAGYVASATDQKIVLQNMDLSGGGTLSNDAAIIHDLLSKGKLQTY